MKDKIRNKREVRSKKGIEGTSLLEAGKNRRDLAGESFWILANLSIKVRNFGRGSVHN